METPEFKFALREDLIDFPQFLPTKAEPQASGFDVCAAPNNKQDIIIKPGQFFKIPLGFRCLPAEGWYYELHPRSSSFTKKYMHNLIGIIDESWEGETLFAGQYLPDERSLKVQDLIVKFGEKIGQIIPIKRNEIKILKISNKELDVLFAKRGFCRKSTGFGSTG